MSAKGRKFVITVYATPTEVEVNLSPSQVKLAERLGIDPFQYAKHIYLEGASVDPDGITGGKRRCK